MNIDANNHQKIMDTDACKGVQNQSKMKNWIAQHFGRLLGAAVGFQHGSWEHPSDVIYELFVPFGRFGLPDYGAFGKDPKIYFSAKTKMLNIEK